MSVLCSCISSAVDMQGGAGLSRFQVTGRPGAEFPVFGTFSLNPKPETLNPKP